MLSLFTKYKDQLFTIAIYLNIFLFSIFPYRDSDWGAHYRHGEYFFKHGKILKEDIFSWTMQGFIEPNYAWGTDIATYLLTNSIGFRGMAIASGLVAVIVFFVITRGITLKVWQLAVSAFFFVMIIAEGMSEGLRGQEFALIFFALLMLIVDKAREKPKLLFTLPPLFLVWANIHGDFLVGLLDLFVFSLFYFFTDIYKKKIVPFKTIALYFAPFFLSFLAIGINPYGYKTFAQLINTFQNPWLDGIHEWNGIFNSCNVCNAQIFGLYTLILGIISLAAVFTLSKKNIQLLPYIIIVIIFIVPVIQTRRLEPLFIVITLPLFNKFLEKINVKFAERKMANYYISIFLVFGIIYSLFIRLSNYHIYTFNENDYCDFGSQCSPKLAEYVLENPPEGRGFNYYDWGGYLIGKGFPSPLFIDGRMGVWVAEDGYQPFGDYMKMYFLNDSRLFEYYNFDWLIIEDDSNISQSIQKGYGPGNWKLEFQDGNVDYFIRIR
jgi:hypothetical protein